MRALFLALALTVPSCTKKPAEPPAASVRLCGSLADGSRAFQVLHLNDVYRIEGVLDGRGGLARVRTLRRDLEARCPGAVLLTHAGDALFPSLLSREYKGAQMIDVLNALDGAPGQVDPLMLFTPGNHEFDKGRLKDAGMLQARIDESEFTWLDTNISWKTDADGAPLVASERLANQVLIDVGGVRVGAFGLTIDKKVPEYVSLIDDDVETIARTRSADLREQGAEVVIAVTHLEASVDAQLLDRLGEAGPDLIVGGHDHALQTAEVAGRYVLKGDADALRVRVATVSVDRQGAVRVKRDKAGVTLGPGDEIGVDPDVGAIVQEWMHEHEVAACGADALGCLDVPLTESRTTLIAEETTIRRYETNVGNWVADRMLDTYRAEGAQVAFVNSGALRMNQDVAAGTPLSRRIVEEIFAYPAGMQLIEIDAATLRAVLDNSVSDWTGSGHWLQVGGVAFRHDIDAETATDITLLTADGPRPLGDDDTIRAVTVQYLLDPTIGDQDGYAMLAMTDVVETPKNGTDLKAVVLDALTAAGDAGIGPTVEGRICNTQRPGPCLAVP